MRSTAWSRTLLVAWGVALLLATGAALLVLASDHDERKASTIALALTAGLTFVGSGLIALWRRPDNRTGFLLAAVGYLWFLGALTESNDDWTFTIGTLVGEIALATFAHLLLAYPEGRLSRRRDKVVVLVTYALVVFGNLAVLLVDRTPYPGCDTCRSTIAIGDSELARNAVELTFTVAAFSFLIVLLSIVAGRYRSASPALRRVLGPVLAVGSLTLLTLILQVVVGFFSDEAADPLGYVFLTAFGLVPFAFLAGILRSRLARSAIGDLLLALGRGTGLRDALAEALHDPSLEVVYWLPERGHFVWHDGNEFQDEGGPRIARYVERHGQRVAAVLHDPALADEPELVDAVSEAAGLWLENERLQAELRAQLAFLETIVNTAPSLLMSLDPEGRIVNYNEACERASGHDDPEAIRQMLFWDVFISPTERDAVRERFVESSEHPPGSYENAFVNARGEELVIAWSTAPLLDEDGHVSNIICGGLDVTERERRETALRSSEERLRAAIEASPVAIVEYALDDTITRWNAAAERIFGWTAAEVIGGPAKHQPPERAAELAELFRRVRGGEVYTGVESRRIRKDGSVIEVEISAAPICDAGGEVVSHMALFADITERKRQLHELQASEERLRASIEASPVAIVEYAIDDTITRWNPAAERIFGWTAEQMIGGTPKHRPPGREEEVAEVFRRIRAGERYQALETKRLRNDGSLIDVEISTASIFDAAGVVVSYMALYADITDRKRQDEEVRASRARIVEAGDGARRQLERNLHDGAQQRLVALSLSLRLAQSKVGSDPGAAEAVLEGARTELAAALDELRELARGIHPAVLTDRGLAAAVEALASRSPVPVDVEISDEPLPQSVEAAAYYVIAESLTNVTKYAGATGVTVRVHREDGRALVEVGDDGVGGADPATGSGLRGLADRVEALGGTLAVESPPGVGTRILAELPVVGEGAAS